MDLIKWDKIKSEIAECQDIVKLTKLSYSVEAVQKWSKQSGQSLETQNEVAAYRLRLDRKRGQWVDENIPEKGGNPTDQLAKNSRLIKPTLKEAGIGHNESPKLRALASIPEEAFEEHIIKTKKDGKELTSSGILNLSKNIEREKRATQTETPEIDDKKFRILYSDPPWKYSADFMNKYGHAESHYKTMTQEELCDLPVKEMTEDDAVLFLWVTSPKLPEGLAVLKAWGFKYKTSFVWNKLKHNFGHYNSVRHEFLLIGGKGKSTPDAKELHPSVIDIERAKHSEKPEYFREMIDKLYIRGKRRELFARGKVPPNWDGWGYENED